MSIEISLHPHYEADTKRTLRRKKLIDHLISLAPHHEEPDALTQAESIVRALGTDNPSQQLKRFSDLEKLAVLKQQHPDEPRVNQALSDSAEYLLEAIANAEPTEIKSVEGLSNVWASLKAWDVSRSQSTAKLCVTLLDNFRGEGQPHLVAAYVKARDNDIPFEQALDEINAANPTGEIAA